MKKFKPLILIIFTLLAGCNDKESHDIKAISQNNFQSLIRQKGVDYRDRHGDTFLHKAVAAGRSDLIQILIDKNAKVDVLDDYFSVSPLYWAVTESQEVFDLILHHSSDYDLTGSHGQTPLMRAAQHGNLRRVKQLINKGAKPKKLDQELRSALFYSAEASPKRWSLQLFDFLLSIGSNPNLKGKYGVTVPVILIRNGHYDGLALLCDKYGNHLNDDLIDRVKLEIRVGPENPSLTKSASKCLDAKGSRNI